MPLGTLSLARLETCHPELKDVILEASRLIDDGALAPIVNDLAVTCGQRGEADQNAAFAGGFSEKRWPDSKHNRRPSDAVDVAPYPIDYSNELAFDVLRGFIVGVAASMGIRLRLIRKDRPHLERRLG